jgi:TonB-dependent SusC/RagA subfamily outer membrane receptor
MPCFFRYDLLQMKSRILLLLAALLFTPFNLPVQGNGSKKVKINGYVMSADGKPIAGAVFLADDFEYGKIRQSPAGATVNELDGSKYASIYELIQGELPGVQVMGTSITVMQGQASLDPNASFEPLIILNGAPISSIGNIHPSHVKSVALLKGADASLYGSRGANGVIIIELK